MVVIFLTVHLTFYDGTDCIGSDKIPQEDGDMVLLLDFGINFKIEAMYFNKFFSSEAHSVFILRLWQGDKSVTYIAFTREWKYF